MFAVYVGIIRAPVALFATQPDAVDYASRRFLCYRVEPVDVIILPPAAEAPAPAGQA